jgi:6-phosphogluconolactonase
MAEPHIIAGADDAEVADWLEARLGEALAHGPAAICVPGGSTPFPILAELVKRPLGWARLTVWPTDERIVPASDPASNLGRIAAILGPAGATCVQLTETARPPRFALSWLGLGTDGHVASLFPSSDPRADDSRAIVRLTPSPLPPEAPYDRLSLTIPALLDSDALLFVIRGADKRRLFEQAAAGGNDLPVARLLATASQPVTCFS